MNGIYWNFYRGTTGTSSSSSTSVHHSIHHCNIDIKTNGDNDIKTNVSIYLHTSNIHIAPTSLHHGGGGGEQYCKGLFRGYNLEGGLLGSLRGGGSYFWEGEGNLFRRFQPFWCPREWCFRWAFWQQLWSFCNQWQHLFSKVFFLYKYMYESITVWARTALSLFNDVSLRIWRALSLYKNYGDSALLVLNGTALKPF